MATVGAQSAYATDVIAVQRVFYGEEWGFACAPTLVPFFFFPLTLALDKWMLVMSTQLIGFSIGGIARRFLVAPPSMSTPHFHHMLVAL